MLPAIRGVIDRRLLLNYRVEPEALDEALPARFEPKVVNGYGMGGVCLIRLRDVRPRGVPAALGTGSENAAHRIAVEWDAEGERREGVYVPRRDTDSRLNSLLGGRLFAGEYHPANFDVREEGDRFAVTMESTDGETHVHADGRVGDALPADSVFDTAADASAFFERGSVGYSPDGDGYEGIELHTFEWEVTPFAVESVASSYFEALSDDAVAFDHALLMRDIDHEWREREALCSVPAA